LARQHSAGTVATAERVLHLTRVTISLDDKRHVQPVFWNYSATDISSLPRDLVLYLARHEAGLITPGASGPHKHQHHPAVHAPRRARACRRAGSRGIMADVDLLSRAQLAVVVRLQHGAAAPKAVVAIRYRRDIRMADRFCDCSYCVRDLVERLRLAIVFTPPY
jgi:hypothetical protein